MTTLAEPVSVALVRRGSLILTLAFLASVPIEDAQSVANHSLARLAGIGAFGGTVLLVLATGRLRLVRPVLLAALLFVAWAAASFTWTVSTERTVTYVVIAIQLVAVLVVVWQQIDSWARLRLALIAIVAGSAVGSVITLLSAAPKHGGAERFAVGDPNDFGVMVATAAVMTLYLLRTSQRVILTRLVYSALLLLQIVALLRTGSRAAGIALALGLIVLLAERANFTLGRVLIGLGLAVGAVIAVQRYVDTATIDRVTGALHALENGDFNNRTEAWSRAIEVWQRAPVQGVGAGAFRTIDIVNLRELVAHSIFFGLMAELGLVGLGLFLGLAATTAAQLRFLRGRALRLWYAVFATWLCAALTLTFEVRKMTWVLIALASAVALMPRPEPAAPEPLVTTAAG